MGEESASTIWSRFKEVFWPPLKEGATIYVPQWYDVIHFYDEKQLPEEQRKQIYRQRAIQLSKSPSPKIAKNIGTVLTTLDDLGDFLTTQGALLRLIGRKTVVAEYAAKGTFALKELADVANSISRAPFRLLSPAEIKELIARFRKKRIEATPEQIAEAEARLSKEIPEWNLLSAEDRMELINLSLQDRKLTRIFYGKAKKRALEKILGNGTLWKKFSKKINDKVKRTIPTLGESLEIAQTSDMLAGIGLSFGPIVGFVQDLIFGLPRGAKLEFKPIIPEFMKDVTLTDKQKEDAWRLFHMTNPYTSPPVALYSASQILAASGVLDPIHTVQAIWTAVSSAATEEYMNTKEAIIEIWKDIKYILFGPPKRTDPALVDVLCEFGVYPETPQGFAGISLEPQITIEQFLFEAIPFYQQVIFDTRRMLEGTWYGDFFDMCVEDLALLTVLYFCDWNEPIEIAFSPELACITRAIYYDLDPPIYATNDQYYAWLVSLLDFVELTEALPDYETFQVALNTYFPDAEAYA
jgi:hypothetical protein